VTTKLGSRTTAVLRIIDNELSVGFSAPNYSVRENAGLATITVELTGVNLTPVTVNYSTADDTATAGTDYVTPLCVPAPCRLIFPPGGTPTSVRTRTFAVRILNDLIVEGTKRVNLTLSVPPGGAAQLPTGRDMAVLSITEDDVAGTIQFSALTFNAIECPVLACNATLTVSRTGGFAKDVTVDFATANGTAAAGADFGTLGDPTFTGTVTFGAGQVIQTIRIPLLGEVGPEPTKSFTVVLSNPGSGGVLGARTSATVNIIDTR
jgi:hypothetical protein